MALVLICYGLVAPGPFPDRKDVDPNEAALPPERLPSPQPQQPDGDLQSGQAGDNDADAGVIPKLHHQARPIATAPVHQRRR